MTHKDFDKFLNEEVIKSIVDVLSSKSADYSDSGDKLYNFKLAAGLDCISPIEALRGMWLKHRASINQGLDELIIEAKCRDYKWWKEKIVDSINYQILLLAMIKSEEY